VKDPEADDPMELVGVAHLADISEETDRETARCLVEEYALNGFSGREILRLFASPNYALPYGIYQRRGDEFVSSLVGSVFGGPR
jgi:hypothetical protein